MSKRTIQVLAELTRAGVMTEEHTGDTVAKRISISSDTPYLRYDWYADEDYYEVLSHAPGDVGDARLKAGLPALFNHRRDEHLGRATKFENDGHRITVGTVDEMIWSESADAQTKKKDVESGALVGTSVGYSILDDGECIGAEDGIPIYKFKWEPHEFSFCTIEADITVGAGRALTREQAIEAKKQGQAPALKTISVKLEKDIDDKNSSDNNATNQKPNTMKKFENQIFREEDNGGGNGGGGGVTVVDEVKVGRDAVSKFQAKCKRIDAWVEAIKNPDQRTAAAVIANKHKEGEADFDAFRTAALDSFDNLVRVDTPTAELGLSKKELKRYSLARAIYTMGTRKSLDGFEKECSDAQAKLLRKDPDGFFIPEDWSNRSLAEINGMGGNETTRQLELMRQITGNLTRTLTAGNFTSAGALIGTDLLSGSFIELLRNKMVFGRLGMTQLGGLVGNIAIPRQSGGATAYWLAEGATVTETDQQFQQLALTPHRLSAQTAYDKQLLAQSTPSIEGLVRNDLAIVMGLKRDLAILVGSGVDGEPLGIYSTSGVQTVTFGAAATWAKVLEFETDLATANADQTGMPVWITSPAVRGKWKAAPKIAASTFPIFLWGDDQRVNGYDTSVSNQISASAVGAVPANAVYFGVPGEVISAEWAGTDVVVNPFSLDSTGQIRVTIMQYCDTALRHSPSWIVSTDSGAQ